MTKMEIKADARRAANLSFAALLFALVGWANLEVFALSTKAGFRGQWITLVLGLYLSTIAYRRCQFWRSRPTRSALAFPTPIHAAAVNVAMASALALAGFTLAFFMRTGFVSATVTGAAVLALVPWSRIGFCRQYFFTSFGLPVAGGLPILIIAVKSQHPIILLAHTWVLWTFAAALTLCALWMQRPAAHPPAQSQVGPETCEPGIL